MTSQTETKKTTRRQYSPEFQGEALALAEKIGVAKAANELGLHCLLKVEAIQGERFATHQAMRQTVFEYIKVDYNRTRRHSANGFISPVAFEAQQAA